MHDHSDTRSRESIETIRAIAEIVHGSLDFRTVAERAVGAIITYTPFTGVSISVLDETGTHFELVASQGFSEKIVEAGRRIPMSGSFMGDALQRRELLTSEELDTEIRGVALLRDALVRDGFHRAICCPLLFRDEPLGSLNLVLLEKRVLTGIERNTLQSVGQTIAMALANARYVDRIEREARDRLRAEERHALATAAARVGVWDWNAERGELFLDESLKAMLGYSDDELPNVLETWMSRVHPDDRDVVASAVTEHLDGRSSEFVCEHRMLHRDGSTRWILARGHAIRDTDGTPVRMVGTDMDITDRKRLEEERRSLERQVLHAEKLKSLGVMAGGVAHDFNNLLTTIQGNVGLALMKLDRGAAARPFLEQVDTAARRAAELTRQLLAYSDRGVFVLEAVDLSALVQEMIELLRLSISKKAEFHCEFQENLPRTEGDPGQLRQVIMNLITNASESLGGETGTITVRTGRADPSELISARGDGAALNDCLFFEVRDTGCGMDEEVAGQIFDPFFTTKFTGRGLGLAAVQGIVRGHGGTIVVDSTPGWGTRIRVLLPASSRPAEEREEPLAEVPTDLGNGTALVVDDEEAVRVLAASVLGDVGFDVLTARDGREALQIFSERAGQIRFVLLDLTMPRLAGQETLQAMRNIEPGARIILTSGFAAGDAEPDEGSHHADAFLEKPYTPTRLLQTVQRTLQR